MYFDAGVANAAGTVAIVTNAANAAGGTKSWRVYWNCELILDILNLIFQDITHKASIISFIFLTDQSISNWMRQYN